MTPMAIHAAACTFRSESNGPLIDSSVAALSIAENAVKEDVEDFVRLILRPALEGMEVIREQTAVEQHARDICNLIDGDIANAALADQRTIEFLPAANMRFAVFEVRGPFSVPELGPLLDQELDKFGVLGTKAQEG